MISEEDRRLLDEAPDAVTWADKAWRILGDENPPIPDRYITAVESEIIEIDWEAVELVLWLQDLGGR